MSPVTTSAGWNRELGPGRATYRGQRVGLPRKPRPPVPGAWERRLQEIRAEREAAQDGWRAC